MENAEKLKNARNILLKLHKSMLDLERYDYEQLHGPVNSGEFLNLLLEKKDFAWLRKISTLIVEIDEMFAQKDGVPSEMVDANLKMMTDLVELKEVDADFRQKYQFALQNELNALGLHTELKKVLHSD